MTAWVLIFYLGTNAAMTVPGIESEQECRALAEKMTKERTFMTTSNALCFSYRAVYRF